MCKLYMYDTGDEEALFYSKHVLFHLIGCPHRITAEPYFSTIQTPEGGESVCYLRGFTVAEEVDLTQLSIIVFNISCCLSNAIVVIINVGCVKGSLDTRAPIAGSSLFFSSLI